MSGPDAMLLGEKLLSLLDDAPLSSTYKPALLLALLDRCQQGAGSGEDPDVIPVRDLAARVAEHYWPQTVAYPRTGAVLTQNQGAREARIVRSLVAYRGAVAAGSRRTLAGLDAGPKWEALLDDVTLTLAEMPVPRLQEPYEAFLYDFDWPWKGASGWRVGAFRASSQAVRLKPGVGAALLRLAPLMRPFIVRWWTDKAAALNRHAIPDADALIAFEDFLFGLERTSLRRLASSLLDLQSGDCFYCGARAPTAEVDHFLPWSHSADNGVDNLVMACRRCNGAKRAVLPGADHVGAWVGRTARWSGDLASIAAEKQWPRDLPRTRDVGRALYLRSPDERPTWSVGGLAQIGPQRAELAALLR